MKVKISAELLEDSRDFDVLDDIARHFQTGRHVWDIPARDIEAIEGSAWLLSEVESRAGRRNREVFEKSAKFAVEQRGAQIDAGGEPASRCHTALLDISSNQELRPSLRELEQPARVFLEDGESDARFLTCVVRAYERAALGDALESTREWVVFEHCGGKTSIKRRVEDTLARSAMPGVSRRRMLALLDSDRYYAAHESQGVTTARTITTCMIAVHMLRKREAENYIPVGRLAELDQQYQAASETFAALTTEQRDHFDMKNGFGLKQDKVVLSKHHRPLYESVPEVDKRALVGGFGKNCGRVFESDIAREELDEVCSVPDEQAAARELLGIVLAMEALV